MWKYSQKCKVCSLIDQESGDAPYKTSRLFKLVDDYHLKGTTLTAIAEAYKGQVAYLTIRKHAMEHQHPSPKKLQQNLKAEVLKKEALKPRHHTTDRDRLIQKAMELFESGGIKISGATLAKLLKDEADIEAKRKDQDIDILRIMSNSRSGELDGLIGPKTPEFDPWIEGELIESE